MRVVLQRVKEASVKVGERTTGTIQNGLLILLGVEEADTEEDADWLVRKISQMRIFPDPGGKMNLSALDENYNCLVVSQFTLHASTKKGNRPSFIGAAHPEKAESLYNYFNEQMSGALNQPVETGEFGAMMQVSLINDGPVTILMDSKNKQ